ncbi:MAG: hypothetical protein SGJ23_01200 [Alphaproteobacteria bacterium]|nr:hypothetical protein [Alphaproteobacteria bacterium]
MDDVSATLFRAISYRNSFQTRLSLDFLPGARGCSLKCSIGPPISVVVFLMFLVFWFSGVVLIGGTITLTAMLAPERIESDLPTPVIALFPLVMLGFGVGLVSLGRWLARDEERFLIEFLCETLEAKPELPGGSQLVR